MKNIYINSAKQISVQKPLCNDWFDEPVLYNAQYVRAMDPDFRQYFTPNEARRYGKILKRALLVSREALKECNLARPDAIITGTGLGCIENTELFLKDMIFNGEECLKPTHFMNSTHNTISSLIAIDTHCCAYNTTYSHKGASFENALLDAFMQLEKHSNSNTCSLATALVGAHDEMTPDYFTLLKRIGYLGQGGFAGETAVAMILATEKSENYLCKIDAVELVYENSADRLHGRIALAKRKDIDYVMIGINGNHENDKIYFENCQRLFPNVPLLQYKNVFGESYTASAFGVYAAALCLQKGKIPQNLFAGASQETPLRNILIYNHFEGKNHSFVLLS
ncbi:MAG: beta-ketoacyl synthase chain length factor [Prevotellaceae bacterium]|jgi:3-oxoacyl-(acyl-carrier-protein) synthase|nr:beta-ketoacyl synthase chain length factor [Prevotellaceae bacterium]